MRNLLWVRNALLCFFFLRAHARFLQRLPCVGPRLCCGKQAIHEDNCMSLGMQGNHDDLNRYCVFFRCQRSWQALLNEDDIRNHIGQQRSTWEKCFDFYACANCRREYKRADIGRRASFTCTSCYQSTCVQCSDLAHPGVPCREDRSALQKNGKYVRCPNCWAPHAVPIDSMDPPNCRNCCFRYGGIDESFVISLCSRFASTLQELSAVHDIRISGVRGIAACGEPCVFVLLIAVRIQTWTLQAKAAPHWPR